MAMPNQMYASPIYPSPSVPQMVASPYYNGMTPAYNMMGPQQSHPGRFIIELFAINLFTIVNQAFTHLWLPCK